KRAGTVNCSAHPGPMRTEPERSPVLGPAFFDRPADVVARDLIGRTLVHRLAGRRVALDVTETEAYLGPHDLAYHAARGKTSRTKVMRGRLRGFRLRATLDAQCRN